MTPNEKGAFCLSCQKQVVDFSVKTLQEIKSFFMELPLSEKVCGRFQAQQMEALSFDEFFRRFKTWRLLHKIAVICFFVFGTGLFSCAPKGPAYGSTMGEVVSLPDTPASHALNQPAPLIQDHIITGDTIRMPADTSRKRPGIKSKATEQIDRRLMIQGDVSIEPEEPACIPKDSTHTQGKVMGKIKRE